MDAELILDKAIERVLFKREAHSRNIHRTARQAAREILRNEDVWRAMMRRIELAPALREHVAVQFFCDEVNGLVGN